MEILDESGRMTQKLYGRMVFDTFPQAKARIQPREVDGGTVVSVTYVMPFLGVLYHRFFECFCTIWGLGNFLWWLWVIRHGWGNLSPNWRSMLIMGSLLWVGISVGTFAQLPLSDYPSKLSVWLEDVGKLERLPESTD
jgi:hypothetical protein